MAEDERTRKYREAAEKIRQLTEGPLQDAIRAQREQVEATLRQAQQRNATRLAELKH